MVWFVVVWCDVGVGVVLVLVLMWCGVGREERKRGHKTEPRINGHSDMVNSIRDGINSFEIYPRRMMAHLVGQICDFFRVQRGRKKAHLIGKVRVRKERVR